MLFCYLWPRNHVATRSHDIRVTASEMRYLSRDSKSVYLNIEHFDTQTSAYLYRLPTDSDNSGTSLTTFNPCQPSEILTSRLSVLIDARLRGHCDHSLHCHDVSPAVKC